MSNHNVSAYRRAPLTPRRQREGLCWRGDAPPPRNWKKLFRNALFITAGILFLLCVHAWMQLRDMEAELEDQKAKSHRYSRLLADCLNGGGIYDSANKQGLFCGRAIVVKY